MHSNAGMKRRTFLAAAGSALCAGPLLAAENWPNRSITLVVPYAAGGGSDILARLFAARLKERTGQAVIVENKAGGSTMIATRYVEQQKPDGYTIYLTSPQFSTGPGVQPSLFAYDPVEDFTPIARLTSIVLVLLANPSRPYSTVPEFIAYARANPGKVSVASTGSGSSPHLAAEVFQSMTGTTMNLIQYKGASQAMQDLVSGVVDARFDSMPTALPMVRGGRVRALGVATKTKSTLLPEVPTIGQFVPGYEMTGYYGLVGPKGMRSEIVDRIAALSEAIMAEPPLVELVSKQGLEPAYGAAAEYRSYLKQDYGYWSETVKRLNIKVTD